MDHLDPGAFHRLHRDAALVQGKGDTPRPMESIDLPRLGVPRVLHPIAQIPAQQLDNQIVQVL